MIGTVLSNRYKIIGELGSGGMAWVYLAEDLRDHERVAVKVLYPQHGQDLNFLQRFMQEAKLAMSLSQCAPGRHIVCVLDYGSDKDTHYLVMEYVQGQDLGHILAERGPLPWQEALEIARQVAVALDHAHHYEIVHRDIKPGNIMVLPDGDVRVLDFGIARARTSPHLTLSGFVGSPHYAAPEQAMGQPVDTRADLYALGVVIYRMLSGKLPFEGNTPWAIVNQHIAEPPPPLDQACPDLPKPVIHLVEKAMAKRPEDRYQTPFEMSQAIEEVLAGHDLPVEAAPAQPGLAEPALEALYQRARQAAEAEAWHEAVDLYSRILKIDPDYGDVTEQLARMGMQIRLATHYRAAKRALQVGQWDEALTQLDKIANLDPEYEGLDELRTKAQNREKLPRDEKSPVSDFPTQVEELAAAAILASPGVSPVPAGPTPDSASPSQEPSPDSPQEEAELAVAVSESPSRRRTWLWVLAVVLIVTLPLTGFWLYRSFQSPAAVVSTTHTPPATTAATATQPVSPTSRPETTATEPAPSPTPRRLTATLPPTPSATALLDLTSTPTPTLTPTSTLTVTVAPLPTRAPKLEGQIAFPRFDSTRGTYDVHICRVDGSDCKRVASAASQPDFLPGGNRIVLKSWKADDKGLILQTSSGERVWKISDDIEAARPSVDFQGQIYVYHSRQEADRQTRLYRTYAAETRPIRREGSTVTGSSPSWLPDGRILYSGCWQDSCGIIVMRSDGTFPRQMVAGGEETNPEASPDGRRVVFMSRRDGNWEVYGVNADGSDLQRLTNNPANDGLPTWSPDGQYIAFVSDREGGWAVWVMKSDGSDKRRLFAIGGPLDGQVRDAASHESHGWVEERISWSPLP